MLLVCPLCSTLNASECPAGNSRHFGNSLLQTASLRSQVDVPFDEEEEEDEVSSSHSSSGLGPPRAVASAGYESTSVLLQQKTAVSSAEDELLEEQPTNMPALLDISSVAVATHSASHDAASPAEATSEANVSTNVVPPPPSALLQVNSIGGKAAEVVAAGKTKWVAAILLARTLGTHLHVSLVATAVASGSYVMIPVAIIVGIIALTAYLFLQFPGKLCLLDRESIKSDGTIHASPTPHAAVPKRSMGGPMQGTSQLLQARLEAHTSSNSKPSAAHQLLLPSTNSSLCHYNPPLTAPYSAGGSQVSTGMSMTSGAMPPSARQLPRTPAEVPNSMATKGLCPGLIVPDESECVLTICVLSDIAKLSGISTSNCPAALASSARSVDIFDLEGKPVMRAHVVFPWPQDAAFKQRPPVITLCSTNPNTPGQEQRLSFCRAGGDGGGRRSMYIYDKDDVLFGCIKRDVTRPRYVLTSSRGGLQLLFEGDFHQHTVNVLSDNRDMLSHSEPCSKADSSSGMSSSSSYYQVRITAGIDVGLIMSGLLSIEAMETA